MELNRAKLRTVMKIADRKLKKLGIHLDYYLKARAGSESSIHGGTIYWDGRDATGFGAVKKGSLNLLLHELGHKFQTQIMSDADKRREDYVKLFGPYHKVYKRKPGVKPDRPNFISKYAQAHPQEDFAEVFSIYVDMEGDLERIKRFLAKKEKGGAVMAQMQWLDHYVKGLREDVKHPTYDQLTSECERLAHQLGMKVEKLPNGAPVLIHGDDVKLVMLSGTHGDERSGPMFLEGLLREFKRTGLPKFGFAMVPALNDQGWDDKTRTWHGQNLNRAFGKDSKRTDVTEALKKLLTKLKPDYFWDIHEDSTQKKFYIFKCAEEPASFYDRLARHLGTKPVLWYKDNKIWRGRDAESFMLRHGAISFTSEAPPSAPLNRRLAWLTKIYKWLSKEISGGGTRS